MLVTKDPCKRRIRVEGGVTGPPALAMCWGRHLCGAFYFFFSQNFRRACVPCCEARSATCGRWHRLTRRPGKKAQAQGLTRCDD